MRTTTVVWAKDPTLTEEEQTIANEAKTQEVYDAAEGLAGFLYRAEIEKQVNEDNTEVTMTRAWPDLATAQAWVDLVLSKGAKSAQVNPE